MTMTASAVWTAGALRNDIDVNGRHTIATDVPLKLGGNDTAPAPHELLPAMIACFVGLGKGCGRFCVAILAVVVLTWFAPSAFAADSLYWSNTSGSAIRVGPLAGGTASDLFGGQTNPEGVALDPAAGKIYWADFGGTIWVGNLDGSGTPTALFTGESNPFGLAIDAAAGKLYWADAGSGAIRVGSVSGGTASDLFTGESTPLGVAVDPTTGKLYWANRTSHAIRVGSVSGGTASDLFTGEPFGGFQGVWGVAVDPSGGKIYWSNNATGAIREGSLAGGTAADLLSTGGLPVGLAIDAAAGNIYWTDPSSGDIVVGSLSGGGTPSSLFTGENVPQWVVELRSPLSTSVPQVSGSGLTGGPLTCNEGGWAGDIAASFLYRAPRTFSYQWSLNGTAIGGATGSTYTPTAPGSYTCRVTATNQAGSTSQTSAAVTVSPAPPAVTTGSASGIGTSGATLNGTVNPEGLATTYEFQYGATTAYGSSTPGASAGSGSSKAGVSTSISGLKPNATYHYRLVASNASGTTDGADMTFKTASPPAPQPVAPAGAPVAPAGAPVAPAAVKLLKLSVSPHRTVAGKRACYSFRATSSGRGVSGVTIRFTGRAAHTSSRGKARICETLSPRGTYKAHASKSGYRSATARVTAKPKPKPLFTG